MLVSDSDDMQRINFLKDTIITPSEVKWLSARSNPISVMILARTKAHSALKWTPLVDNGDINIIDECSRIAAIQAERERTIVDCNQLLMPKKQRGIVDGEEFVSHGNRTFKLEGLFDQNYIIFIKLVTFCAIK